MNLRGKTLACFVALAHHTRFLRPITEVAARQGARVIFFLPLSDYPFERELTRLGYPYRYIQDYLDDGLKRTVADSYNRLIDQWVERYGRWDGIRLWPLFEQERSQTACVEEYFCIERFIQKESPDAFLALHERNRWGKLIGHLANKHGVPFITLQEGDYHEHRLSFSAHTEYSTVDLLWGGATRDMLVRHHCSDDKIILVGNTHLDNARATNTTPDNVARIRKELGLPPDRKILLMLLDLEWGAVLDVKIWRDVLQDIPKDLKVVFKWHPSVKRHTFLKIAEGVKSVAPDALILYTHDAYELLAVADYCVTLGKTTLALEAVAFGKPLFAIPGLSNQQKYYADMGVAFQIEPVGNWQPLVNVMRDGVPPVMREATEKYLTHSFYKLDGRTVERVLSIAAHAIASRGGRRRRQEPPPRFERPAVPGRISFIVPTGHDGEAFIATITALGQNVKYADWEVIVVVNDADAEQIVRGLGGDVAFVKDDGDRLGALYNKGAQIASGEVMVFMKPGMVFVKGDDTTGLALGGVVGVPVRNADMSPRCLGIHFDFNYTPQQLIADGPSRDAVGGGWIATSRAHFKALGGFDEDVANHLIEADLCLAARARGVAVNYDPGALAVRFKETFPVERSDEHWQPRVRFFAKWVGTLPKDDDYLSYAEDLLKV